MNWTTANMDLNDDQARIRSTDLNQFTIQGGESLYKSIKLKTSIILMVTIFSLYFSGHPLMEGLFYYIIPFEPY